MQQKHKQTPDTKLKKPTKSRVRSTAYQALTLLAKANLCIQQSLMQPCLPFWLWLLVLHPWVIRALFHNNVCGTNLKAALDVHSA